MKNNRFSGLTAVKALQNSPEATKQPEVIKTLVKPNGATEKSAQEARRRGRPNGKRSNADFRQVTAYINADRYKRTKMKLLEQDNQQEFSELIDVLLAKWLEE
jgi:uncharacterized Rmd1/YagE family protein